MKKTKLAIFVTLDLLLLSASTLLAQNTTNTIYVNTNSIPITQTLQYQTALENDRALGEQSILPPGLKEKMRLTDEQRMEMKPIEDDFAATFRAYQAANQPRIDAAQEANRQARESKDSEQIDAARKQLQDVWAGLQSDRDSAVKKIQPLLTPDQITILEDSANQWRENHVNEANDPSAN